MVEQEEKELLNLERQLAMGDTNEEIVYNTHQKQCRKKRLSNFFYIPSYSLHDGFRGY